MRQIIKTSYILLLLLLAGILLCPFLALRFADAQTQSQPTAVNPELARMYAEDQSDRMPPGGKPIDWTVVTKRDKDRLARVKQLYTHNQLQAGGDYYHAAMILQHSDTPEDYLLAHELCVVAISKGDIQARWLAAASEDRFLMNIGRAQRFGTQYRSTGANAPFRLYRMEEGVTDALRRALDVPSLAQARAREAEMNKSH